MRLDETLRCVKEIESLAKTRKAVGFVKGLSEFFAAHEVVLIMRIADQYGLLQESKANKK